MRKLITLFLFIFLSFCTSLSFALLNLELTQGMSGAFPIAIVPFSTPEENARFDIAEIVKHDLQNSGRFKVSGRDRITHFPKNLQEIKLDYFRSLGSDHVVIGQVKPVDGNRYQISFQLLETIREKPADKSSVTDYVLLNKTYTIAEEEARSLAHHISDMIYQKITGVRGVFSTRLAYVVVEHLPNKATQYRLEVSDQDGFNPTPLLISNEPIMSPAWSPDGKKIAYVSFEKRKASIYIEEVATGRRILVSQFPGINGAPAWSPDGRKLALVLSKSGTPNIYLFDLVKKQLLQLTHDYYINTEPSWSPNGRSIIFTSNRSGSPQIYQLNLASRQISRVTYEGKYNARASFTPDGNHLVVLNQQGGVFNIGTLDLDSGLFRVLTNSGSDNESPSTAPNGTMVLFGTYYRGKNVLGMVTTDGSVQLRLPARNGDVQDPAWSPFLS